MYNAYHCTSDKKKARKEVIGVQQPPPENTPPSSSYTSTLFGRISHFTLQFTHWTSLMRQNGDVAQRNRTTKGNKPFFGQGSI